MEDGPPDKEETPQGYSVDTRKTYESILSRKEARIAKEAQFERRARFLTRHFLKCHEQKESHKLDHLKEESQRNYDRSMAKVRDGFMSEAVAREMFREENNQIGQLMADRARQKELEEEKRQEAKAEREFYMQARIIHSQLHLEERQRKIEEAAQQRAEAIKERMKGREAEKKERTQERAQEEKEKVPLISPGAKCEADAAKVAERRRQQAIETNKERKEKLSARAEKEQSAMSRRQQEFEAKCNAIRHADTERQHKVNERKRQDEEELLKKAYRINQKGLGPGCSRPPETPRSEPKANSARVRGPDKVADAAAKDGEPESPKGDEKKLIRTPMPSFQDKDLIESNNLAHKDYVLRNRELDHTLQRMNVDKKYKALAEGAAGQPDDYRSARLVAVHQTHLGAKPKETKKKTETAGSDADSSPRGTESRSSRIKVRRSPRAVRCGLCMREFPPDRLVGSALRRTVERMRNQSANLPNNKGESNSQAQVVIEGEDIGRQSVCDATAAKQSPSASNKKRSLYDYEVKLCVHCDIFVRIAST